MLFNKDKAQKATELAEDLRAKAKAAANKNKPVKSDPLADARKRVNATSSPLLQKSGSSINSKAKGSTSTNTNKKPFKPF